MLGKDQNLRKANREPIFSPFFVKFIDSIIPQEVNDVPLSTEN